MVRAAAHRGGRGRRRRRGRRPTPRSSTRSPSGSSSAATAASGSAARPRARTGWSRRRAGSARPCSRHWPRSRRREARAALSVTGADVARRDGRRAAADDRLLRVDSLARGRTGPIVRTRPIGARPSARPGSTSAARRSAHDARDRARRDDHRRGTFSKSEMMIVAAARELAGQRVCFVGVGLPNIAVNLAKRTVAPGPRARLRGRRLRRPAGAPAAEHRRPDDRHRRDRRRRACSSCSRFYLQGGLIDVGFLGAAQIDRFGNINTTVIGDYDHPTTRLPGQRRRVRDRDQRPPGVRDHAPERAQLRRDDRLPDVAPATSAAPSRASGSGASRAGSGAARASSSPTSGSTTSTRRARCASSRSIPGATLEQVRATIGWDVKVAADLAATPPPTDDGAPPDPRGARSGRGLHEVAPGNRDGRRASRSGVHPALIIAPAPASSTVPVGTFRAGRCSRRPGHHGATATSRS